MAFLNNVGLDYLSLERSAETLSGGEAQRVKLATELARPDTGHTLYILDEPTTGLHFHDVARLVTVLQRLVGKGNTAIVIEHNLDVIKCADWLIDLGPEGGDGGGQIVAEGPPAEVAKTKGSYTGHFLQRYFNGSGGNSNKSPEQSSKKTSSKRSAASQDGRRGSKPSKVGGRSTKKSSAKKKAATKSKSASKKPKSATKSKPAKRARKKAVAK